MPTQFFVYILSVFINPQHVTLDWQWDSKEQMFSCSEQNDLNQFGGSGSGIDYLWRPCIVRKIIDTKKNQKASKRYFGRRNKAEKA